MSNDYDRVGLYRRAFRPIERMGDSWLIGFAARLAFAGVLLVYYLNSALTKVGTGFPGLLIPKDGAYVQILPAVMERVGYDISQIDPFPYKAIVFAGTYAEFILPILIVLGLLTRLAALGMIGFIAVQTYVDIAFHGADTATIGALFDRDPGSVIADQRTLWVVLLVFLVVKGAGAFSIDGLFARDVKRA